MTGEQRIVLAAAVERILPSDDGPGAVETGAAAYIERLLETSFHSWQPLFDDGLDRFEELARELYGQSFPESPPEARDEVLRRFQADPDRLRQAFFRKLVSFTLEGFLRDGLGLSYLEAPEIQPGYCLGKTRP
ncbi:MAG TPA: gluconate 2-dehydrogenase subunit 3 family protein [Thermoanaerobaculia bacterium]